jgi:cytochrome c biogenesis protein CcdA
MLILEYAIGFVIPFIALSLLWKGAKEDWERSKT